jgi:Outer membrane protein and related peptidoglycan-associated (lipo)proteins
MEQSMLDTIIHQAAQRGMDKHAGRFIGLLADSLFDSRNGGFNGFRKRFEDAGFATLLNAWIGRMPSDNVLQPDQFSTGFGQQECARIASLLGVSTAAVNMAGAEALPKLIGLLSADGRIPTQLPPQLAALLKDNKPPRQRKGLGWLFWLILAGLIALFIMAVSQCRPTATAPAPAQPIETAPPAESTPPPQSEPVPQSTPAPQAQETPPQETIVQEPVAQSPAQLQLDNKEGLVTVHGQLPSDADKQRLMDALKAQFGPDKVSGDIQVDPTTLPADWLDKLIAALPQLSASGLKFGFEGDKLSIDTSSLPEEQRFEISQQLRSLFSGYTISGLWERATSALAGLKSGFSAQDLVQALNLMHVYFDTNSNVITADSQEILSRAAEAIKAAPQGTRIEVGGHSDSVGTVQGNKDMSQKRADAVVAQLTQLGVDPSMLIAKGFGASKPVADNATEEGRAKNRRIEFTVLGE